MYAVVMKREKKTKKLKLTMYRKCDVGGNFDEDFTIDKRQTRKNAILNT